ncbi:MAG TPA: DUF1028 domain-containing protein [Baekduia sp.]|nr:DUF1028 domain-containing protein [Baekduia sp.]
MTFSLLAVSPETGEHGFVQTTSTPAIGDRCTAVVHNRGVVTVQATGDYRLVRLAKQLLELGYPSFKVVKEVADEPFAKSRQFAAVDMTGAVAVNTGDEASPWAGEVVGPSYVATGNTLAGPEVLEAMSRVYAESEGQDFAERLVLALEAGRDAGGQPDGQSSSAIQVFDGTQPTLNLRVDLHPEPIGHLRKLHDWYKTLRPYYVGYQLDQTSWDLDSWSALESNGKPFYPDGGGWTEADVARRGETIRGAWTTSASGAPPSS